MHKKSPCQEESSERGERDAVAKKHGYKPIPHQLGVARGCESWINEERGYRIDYFPHTDRCLSLASKDGQGRPGGRDLIRDNIGGNAGLEKIFKDIRFWLLQHPNTHRWR